MNNVLNLEKIIAVRNGKEIYKDGENVIKIFDKDYSKSDVLNEALNIAKIEEIADGFKVPAVKEVKIIEGKWAIICEYIEGKTLADLMKEYPEKLDEYLSLFLDLQIKIHKLSSPLLKRLRDKMRYKISLLNIDASIKYELNSKLEAAPKHSKVCHGDFNPSNIIIGNGGEIGVLDWAHVTQGNASADAARTYLLFKLASEKSENNLSNNSEIAEKYLDLFCKKSNTAKKYVQDWMPIVAASQLVKGKQDEREFLLKWLNIADYE